MTTQSSVEPTTVQGPSGFLELGSEMLVVDYGKISTLEGVPAGYLFEDGYLENTSGPLGKSEQLRAIEEIRGCIFRGIDSSGLELELPGLFIGPWGSLNYNNVIYHVANGRVCTPEHRLAGFIDDKGVVYIRDHEHKEQRRKLDENTQLSTNFQGKNSVGKPWSFDFVRQVPNYRKDKSYADNEIIRYFEDYDRVSVQQKKYVVDSLQLWSASGLLQIVRKSEGNAGLSGNVKHGAAAVTGVRSGMVHLDKEEFEREIVHFKNFGSIAVMKTRLNPYVEVRVNLVVAHEFGHQLEFVLSQKTQNQITALYEERKDYCNKVHPLPQGYEGLSEILRPEQVFQRVFISGYARQSMHEYWAECVAAFSMKDGREALKKADPAVYKLLMQVVYQPQEMLRPVFHDTILALQSSLRMGGEFHDRLIEP